MIFFLAGNIKSNLVAERTLSSLSSISLRIEHGFLLLEQCGSGDLSRSAGKHSAPSGNYAGLPTSIPFPSGTPWVAPLSPVPRTSPTTWYLFTSHIQQLH